MGTSVEENGPNPGMGQGGTKQQFQGNTPKTSDQAEELFYGIHIPNCNEDDFLHVYTDKGEALKVVKRHKKARFKTFKTRAEAVAFATNGSETVIVLSSNASQINDAEKPSLFKGPKAQDLVRLRRAIESDDLDLVFNTIWDNPRYLISSGDTPSILQEGSRYNALHVAAKNKNASMAKLILTTVGNPAFCKLLYGEEASDSSESNIERSAILLDLYLNTPDKGSHETPLHFAVKFGALKVVEILLSYPQCDRLPKNKFNQTPFDMVCSRCPDSEGTGEKSVAKLKKEILSLLKNEYYVPVFRGEDNSVQPVVGAPFTVKDPPILNYDPISPRMEIQAYAGPMSHERAEEFHREWRTPQRTVHSSHKNSPSQAKSCPPVFRLRDPEKGLEIAGRELAARHRVPWKEYWPFLGAFIDLTSPDGLQKLEDYLGQRFEQARNQYYGLKEESNKNHPLDSSAQNKLLIVDQSFDTWDHEPEIVSPVTQLCNMMKACTILDDSLGSGQGCGSPSPSSLSSSPSNGSILSSSASRILDWFSRKPTPKERNSSVNDMSKAIMTAMSQPTLSPFLCVEKSLQVFATRIAASLHHVVTGNVGTVSDAVCDVLRPEVKKVQSLVSSYMEDARFVAVDYHLVHSRIAKSVAERLVGQFTSDERESFYNCLQDMVSSKGAFDVVLSSDEEDTPSHSSVSYRQSRFSSRQVSSTNQRSAMRCIASQIVWALDQLPGSGSDGQSPPPPPPQVRTESECLEMWSDAYPCLCVWNSHKQSGSTRGSRKASNKKLYVSGLSCSDNRESVSRRLHYDEGNDNPVTVQNNSSEADCLPDEDGDLFFTPPSSPVLKRLDDSDTDEMSVPDEGPVVFLDGSNATRLDLDVLNALSGCNITPNSHPNIYRWRHEILLHSPNERERWPNCLRKNTTSETHLATSFSSIDCSRSTTPVKTGKTDRTIGPYSPLPAGRTKGPRW